jgi:hypothetical protein
VKSKDGSAFILGKNRQVHSWEAEAIGLEEKDIATKEAIMFDDKCLL